MLSTDISILKGNVMASGNTDSSGAFSVPEPRKNSEKPEFRAAVGLSREWDARKAGREVARDTLEKLGYDPDFFLLFSTIHYKKWGGFQEFLNGVWDILPEGTPLIGGTVEGFMNNYGCFTRGATALAVSYPNMDVAVGVGRNTKRAPHIAAKECASMIKKRMEKSKHKKKFLFDIISGTKIPSIPFMGRRSILRSGLIGKIATGMFSFSELIFQKGFGREEEVLDELTKQLDDYQILHGSSLDPTLTTNYQFYDKKVITDSIVAIGLSSDFEIKLSFACKTSKAKKFTVTSISSDRRVIHKIDGHAASSKFLDLLGWIGVFPTEKQFTFGITTYCPICFMSAEKEVLRPVASIMGNSLVLMSRFDDCEGYTTSTSGKNLLDALDDILIEKSDVDLGIFSSCAVRLMALGSEINATRDKIMDYLNGKPFILIYCAGEAVRNPGDKVHYLNESIASAFIRR